MNKEDYVSPEVAKLLKEKGYKEFTSKTLCGEYDDATLWDAQKWLREKHGIIIDIDTDYYDGFIFTYQAWTLGKISEKESFDTYEQALNEGIKEALKMI